MQTQYLTPFSGISFSNEKVFLEQNSYQIWTINNRKFCYPKNWTTFHHQSWQNEEYLSMVPLLFFPAFGLTTAGMEVKFLTQILFMEILVSSGTFLMKRNYPRTCQTTNQTRRTKNWTAYTGLIGEPSGYYMTPSHKKMPLLNQGLNQGCLQKHLKNPSYQRKSCPSLTCRQWVPWWFKKPRPQWMSTRGSSSQTTRKSGRISCWLSRLSLVKQPKLSWPIRG